MAIIIPLVLPCMAIIIAINGHYCHDYWHVWPLSLALMAIIIAIVAMSIAMYYVPLLLPVMAISIGISGHLSLPCMGH